MPLHSTPTRRAHPSPPVPDPRDLGLPSSLSASPFSPRQVGRRWALLLLIAGLAAGCAPRAEREVIKPSNEKMSSGLADEAKIYTYTAPADGFFASSHYVVTDEGVVIFDTQFLPEYARALHDQIRKHTKAPVLKIYITHPHPDHYFGAAELVKLTRADVSATLTTSQHIVSQGQSKRSFWTSQYGERMPDTLKAPELTFSSSSPGGVGGAVLELKEVGLNESANSMVAWAPQLRALITGDLVFNGSHLFLSEGHSDAWLRELERLKSYQAAQVYPGHGAPGGPELIDRNIEYIKTVQRAVGRYVKPGVSSLRADQTESARKEILEAFPGLANPDFLDLTIPTEFSRQSAALPH